VKKIIHPLIYLLFLGLSIFIILQLYPRIHPFGGIEIKVDKSMIKKKAELIADNLNINQEGRYPQIKLSQNSKLISFIQNKLGIEKANQLLRSQIPGYFYSVLWKDESQGIIIHTKSDTIEGKNKKKEIESLSLEFDLKGNLLELKREIPDDLQLKKLSKAEAEHLVKEFIFGFTSFNNIIEDTSISSVQNKTNNLSFTLGMDSISVEMESEQHTDLSGRMDYKFNWRTQLPELGNDVIIKTTVTGNTISNFNLEYDIPEKYENTIFRIITTLLIVLIFIAFGVLALIVGIKRIRAYEIGFKLAIGLGIFVAVTFAFELYSLLPGEMGWEILLPLIIAPLFYGGGIILLWAVGESVGREVWKEKFISLDLIFRGHILHSSIGNNIVRGVSFGGAAFAVWLLVLWILNHFINLTIFFKDDAALHLFDAFSSAFYILTHNVSVGVYILAALPVLILSLLKNRIDSPYILILITAFIFSLLYSNIVSPLPVGIIVYTIAGAILVWSFYKYDVLAAFLAIFTYFTLNLGASLFFTGNPEYTLSGWHLSAALILVLLYAFTAILTKDHITDFNKITPAFVKHINERQRLQHELEIAREVQMSFLPVQMPEFKGLTIAAKCAPALEVGGDYYDFIDLGGQKIGVAIGDVSGKGTQAAFYMTLTKGFLKAVAQTSLSSADVLIKVNRLFFENAKRNIFISMVYGIFDLNKNMLTLARAGHNPVIMHKRQSGEIQTIQSNGLALGLDKGQKFEQLINDVHIPFQRGDVFLFYTDGLTEAMNKANEEFGEERLFKTTSLITQQPADEIMGGIYREIKTFVGKAEQHDDMTAMVVKIL
jgi:hypothetical protein